MPSLRLLADDLTGALDTAAEFIGLCGPVEVRWANRLPAIIPPKSRHRQRNAEYPRTKAAEIVHGLGPLLHNGTIAYKKVDSLMRGAWPGDSPLASGSASGAISSWRPRSRTRSANPGRQAIRAKQRWFVERRRRRYATNCTPKVCVAVKASLTDTLADGISVFDAETEEVSPRRGCRPQHARGW